MSVCVVSRGINRPVTRLDRSFSTTTVSAWGCQNVPNCRPSKNDLCTWRRHERQSYNEKYLETQRVVLSVLRAPVVFRSADGIYRDNSGNTMLYVCSRYPVCNAYVRTHPVMTVPVGVMANGQLQAFRRMEHRYFDQLHLFRYMSTQVTYRWLAATTSSPMSQAHIGCLGKYYCRQDISRSKVFLEARGVGIENKWVASA